jgi:hypothetical protein
MAAKKSRRYSKYCGSNFKCIRLNFLPAWKLFANKNQICHTIQKTQPFPWAWATLFRNAGMFWVLKEPRARETLPITCPSIGELILLFIGALQH